MWNLKTVIKKTEQVAIGKKPWYSFFYTHQDKKSEWPVDDQNIKGVLETNKQKKVIVERLQWWSLQKKKGRGESH